MARTGRPRKPTAVKERQGTAQKCRLKADEPKPPVEIPTCPTWLHPEAKREWKRVVKLLYAQNTISLIDRAALSAYCQSYATWYRMEIILADDGLTFTTEKGYVGQRPEVSIRKQALADMRAFGNEFGMTPASRSRINAKPREKSDPVKDFLFGEPKLVVEK